MIERPKNDIVEIFGYAPDDLSVEARTLWKLGACPFINKGCTKSNNEKTVVYGACSVTSKFGDCIVCPNRLYEDNYKTLRKVAEENFGSNLEFLTFEEYIPRRSSDEELIVALGQNSGKEVNLNNQHSMDWVLARVKSGILLEYVGIEVQSIDITGNYRDNWYSYKTLNEDTLIIPRSQHGMNWANVHKRLIPQLIRKGLMYEKSKLVKNGLYFILPDIVYKKFEELIGDDIPLVDYKSPSVLNVNTYSLSKEVEHGEQRHLVLEREISFEIDEFSQRFISGAKLPSGEDLDNAVRRALGMAKT